MIMITSALNFVKALRGRRDWARGCSALLTIIDYLSQFATNKSPIANRISLSQQSQVSVTIDNLSRSCYMDDPGWILFLAMFRPIISKRSSLD